MREKIFLTSSWKFYRGTEPMCFYKGFDDSSWETVAVPHDASVALPFDKNESSGTGYLGGGSLCYRKRFALPKTHGKVYITFEGVYNNSKVWFNSYYLGKRPYGYSTFTYDISDFVSEDNVVSVTVDRPETADSRWYTGTGITRRVYVTMADEVSILPDTLFVTTPEVSSERAVVHIEAETTLPSDLNYEIYDGESLIAGGKNDLVIERPSLWSPDSPHLYTLKATVSLNGFVRDELATPFGVRYFNFDPNHGFFLNGESMKLKGVCVHHDAGALGAAVPKPIWKDRLLKLKECGANALRTSHNPPDPELLDLCDELGLLVMDEAFDEWEGPKNKWWQGHNVYPPKRFGYWEDFPEWGECDIKAMVKRDRNHPSIILWSIGNEVDYPNDPYCHPSFAEMTGNNDHNKPKAERMYDPDKPNAERLAVIARRLVKYVKECDTTRPVTAALAFPELSTKTGYFDAVDVAGYNYKEHLYEEDHKRFPDKVIYGSENSHGIDAWRAVRDNEYIAGQFLWTGIDYMGEAHGWPIRASMPGLLDMAGFKKESWYMRKALWSDEPTLYIAARKKPEEDGSPRRHWAPFTPFWNYEEGEEVEIICITNDPGAKLLLNGRDLGEMHKFDDDAPVMMTRTVFEPGELKAVAGGMVCTLNTASKPKKIELTLSNDTLAADSYDTLRAEVTLSDENGNPVPSKSLVKAEYEGENAKIAGLENGDGRDLTAYSEHSRRLNDGRLVIYVKSTDEKGNGTLKVTVGRLKAEVKIFTI